MACAVCQVPRPLFSLSGTSHGGSRGSPDVRRIVSALQQGEGAGSLPNPPSTEGAHNGVPHQENSPTKSIPASKAPAASTSANGAARPLTFTVANGAASNGIASAPG